MHRHPEKRRPRAVSFLALAGAKDRRGVLGFAQGLRLGQVCFALAAAVSFSLQAADNKIQFSDKTDGVKLPSGQPREGGGGLDAIRGGRSMAPTVDPVMVPLGPTQQTSKEKQKWILNYLDRQQNWMFADPKERNGQNGLDGVGGREAGASSDKPEKKSMERFFDRGRNTDSNSLTNRSSGDTDRFDRSDSGPNGGRESGFGNPISRSGDNRANTGPSFGSAPGDSSARGGGGLALPTQGGSLGRIPSLADGDGRLGTSSFDAGRKAGAPREMSTKWLDNVGRPNPLSGTMEPLSLKVDTRLTAPAVVSSQPTALSPGLSSPAAPASFPSASQAPNIALPGASGSLGGIGNAFGGAPGGNAFAPTPAAQPPASITPRQPPVLSFPKRIL